MPGDPWRWSRISRFLLAGQMVRRSSADGSSAMGERIADSPGSWILVPASRGHHRDPKAPRPSRLPLLVAVARRGLPDLLESTIVPAVLFFVLVTTVNDAVAWARCWRAREARS